MKNFDSFRLPLPPLTFKPWVLLPALARLIAGLIRHRTNRRQEVRAEGYAVINEPEYDYSLMTYYVTIQEQTRQLRQAGFQGKIEIFSQSGEKTAADSKSRALYFCATR